MSTTANIYLFRGIRQHIRPVKAMSFKQNSSFRVRHLLFIPSFSCKHRSIEPSPVTVALTGLLRSTQTYFVMLGFCYAPTALQRTAWKIRFHTLAASRYSVRGVASLTGLQGDINPASKLRHFNTDSNILTVITLLGVRRPFSPPYLHPFLPGFTP